MKKVSILVAMMVLVLVVSGCGNDSSENQAIMSEHVAASAQNSTNTTNISKIERDLPEDDYIETGNGTMYISLPGGTSENDEVPVLFVGEDDLLIQIGLDAWEMDGSKLSYIYVDGMLHAKEQLADTQTSIDLLEDDLNVGIHKVEVVQYDNDQPDGEMVTYKVASYEVKSK